MNTTYFKNVIMGNVFHTQESPALPEKYYIGLSDSEPSVDGSCQGEPSMDGTGYTRIEINSLTAPTDGVIKNGEVIVFPTSESDWGTMTHYAVFDSLTGGNLLFYGELDHSRNVEIYTSLIIKAESLSISLNDN